MRRAITCSGLLVLSLLLAVEVARSSDDNSSSSSSLLLPHPIRAAYWPSFSSSYAPLSSINASLFTHMLYAFAQVDAQTFRAEPDDAALMHSFTPAMRAVNPAVKTLLSIGGALANASVLSAGMASSSSRRQFIDSSISLARSHAFDGLNLDWEFPSSQADMNSLGVFLSEWRLAVEKEASVSGSSPLLLTAAVYYSSRVPVVNQSSSHVPYPMQSIIQNLDLTHIMSFDYHGKWDLVTGEHTALDGTNTNFTTIFGLTQWLSDGLPADMAIVGLATYGHSWLLPNDSAQTGVGAPAIGPGPAQNISQAPGIFFYLEIEQFINERNATTFYDNTTSSAYCFADNIWIGYDDARSIATKVRAIKDMGFRGYFFWSVSYDDPKNWSLSTQASLSWETSHESSRGSHCGVSYQLLILMIVFLWKIL